MHAFWYTEINVSPNSLQVPAFLNSAELLINTVDFLSDVLFSPFQLLTSSRK